ncbi:MAG: poly-gamma-glutamate synthase PgsB [Tetragenococcus koreensis]|uniref:poly-gamma-glutamate synthase PgsB n=1 Tax=Tetragenococcus halophilus TaxID=51669 RepID=UPI00077CC4AA|nr:poly-gamma-glutamate synthase PgsB [Tetragenococcus halophilus]MDN5810867.1 poly-gamma-glutamate synthase PgsB [Tetragenococcus koreensis]MDN6194427.1 poly-gamma-glutamate synthase PgsB [Alkalibacterium sp.]MDN6140049.1 poly-gamma-glutamate synthase PgsB [Tetragenococcus koreensis]MDN6270641.1 poly-gamma-glutamate synthase PgsB [Tetragenococcus koreensis]MDN6497549.1 poly-gamma-glutamate synthase PgsB [Tetragenococcus koreensis]
MKLVLFLPIALFACVLIVLGIREKNNNERKVADMPIRVNINGIRGKSTATRLITAVLAEAGYKTMGKTTGTSARKLFPFKEEEIPIVRKPEGPNIKEQVNIINEAASYHVDALVCECMAVRPAYQKIYQNEMFHGNIYVIVNVLEDHLDQMGPTLKEIAYTFSRSIPYNGYLITVQDAFTDFFKKVAKDRGTETIIVDNSQIKDNFLEKFDYILFPDNVGLALAVAEALNIPQEVAYQGMLHANPDPGALKIKEVKSSKASFTFVNAFAANEPSSSLNIWEYIKNSDVASDSPVVLFNGRLDRGDRTEQFAKDFFPYVENATIVAMGQSVRQIDYYYENGFYPQAVEYLNREEVSAVDLMNELLPMLDGRVLLAVGNIHGDAEELLDIIENML